MTCEQLLTFDELLDHYFFSNAVRNDTEWSYRKVVRTFLRFTAKTPSEVDNRLVLEWRRHVLKEQQLQATTWNNKVTHMRALFNFGMKCGLLQHQDNPFNKAVVRAGKKKKKTLTEGQTAAVYRLMAQYEECERLQASSLAVNWRVHACKPAWFWLTVLDTLSYTAIRQNQLRHIRICDVNLEERWLDLVIAGAKNHRELRIPIIGELYPRLERLVTRSLEAGAEPEEQLFNVNRFDVGRRVKQEGEMTDMGIYPIRAFFRRLSRECRFVVSPHRFRHTVATNMMKSPDRNIQAVKRLLGHSSLRSTLEYIDEDVESLRDIMEQEFKR
ncbi:Tyrosine recombinase XerC [Serratia fonticola]|uniref:tyrosine-type recombinase/integrase n=1 Tax=Serratia TaxID=613 RepID=UPI00080FB997|nr:MULTISPECIES: tyrosine-type recombinase/integrase [Serratia]MBC3216970.1 site-specific integrase [Serratia fonticola]OCJ36767.1 integrase [Serratia sp. 14-2641]CAI2040555.1 Tyrosine recombinase XerC [Serratia fonticola]